MFSSDEEDEASSEEDDAMDVEEGIHPLKRFLDRINDAVTRRTPTASS